MARTALSGPPPSGLSRVRPAGWPIDPVAPVPPRMPQSAPPRRLLVLHSRPARQAIGHRPGWGQALCHGELARQLGDTPDGHLRDPAQARLTYPDQTYAIATAVRQVPCGDLAERGQCAVSVRVGNPSEGAVEDGGVVSSGARPGRPSRNRPARAYPVLSRKQNNGCIRTCVSTSGSPASSQNGRSRSTRHVQRQARHVLSGHPRRRQSAAGLSVLSPGDLAGQSAGHA